MSSGGIDIWDSFARWVQQQGGGRLGRHRRPRPQAAQRPGHGTATSGGRGSLRAGQGDEGPWYLAARDPEATSAVLVNHYAKRWTIEPAFANTKDLRFGMGLSSTRIGEPTHRNRLLLVSAFAIALLTLLGTVGESLGMDRLLESSTSNTNADQTVSRRHCEERSDAAVTIRAALDRNDGKRHLAMTSHG
jgi:hypothetical protein